MEKKVLKDLPDREGGRFNNKNERKQIETMLKFFVIRVLIVNIRENCSDGNKIGSLHLRKSLVKFYFINKHCPKNEVFHEGFIQ